MKGVVLSAGRGSRLYPITKIIDKSMLIVYDKPVIFYILEIMKKSGIDEIMIVTTSKFVSQMRELIADKTTELNLNEVSIISDDDLLGMPNSLSKIQNWSKGSSVMVIPGDNVFIDAFSEEVKSFNGGAVAFTREVADPNRFGVAQYLNGKLIDIIEKPKKFIGNLAVTAPYIFDELVFNQIPMKISSRGEYEIVDVLKNYLFEGRLTLINKSNYWKDIGTFKSLTEASVDMMKLDTVNP